MLLKTIKTTVKSIVPESFIEYVREREKRSLLGSIGKGVLKANRAGLGDDPGPDKCISESLAWLCRAQDMSTSDDGGFSRHFSLISGWGPSYPETTGYIIPTMIENAHLRDSPEYLERARAALDWLERIQMPCGGFQGGTILAEPRVPVTFNTGQILIGLACGFHEFQQYEESLHRAATWLVETMDADGCWRRHPTPYAEPGEKTYETHVSWGLLEAARVTGNQDYAEAALKNIHWAITRQTANGWMKDCCLTSPESPLTHTLGYALRGILEGYRYFEDDTLLRAAITLADGLASAMRKDGFLPGRLNADWSAAVDWVCLTGTVQIAKCWFMLFDITGEDRYLHDGMLANSFVRRAMPVDTDADISGGIQGSFPVDGGYGQYEYLNWAAKFFIDANIHESRYTPDMMGS